MPAEHSHRWLTRFVGLLTLTAAYLYGYPSATITYAAVDLLHIAAGAVLTLLLLVCFFRLLRVDQDRNAAPPPDLALLSHRALPCRHIFPRRRVARRERLVRHGRADARI